ncbi:MAG: polyprenyl synthetase family protein [Hyphomonadaceae bacterium]|nr:polyprenyl synthetase family protein [Hyphomonadaceae bacterium]
MAFSQRLNQSTGLVEAHLVALLDNLAAGATPERLIAAMRHGTLSGGKRFRPFLVLETAAMFGLPAEAALETAAAVECVHCYSLIHDDLPAMDDDDMRRGRPTVHKAFDEWTAILAGDALLALAFERLAQPATHADPAVRMELVAELARASGSAGMVGGQCLDLEAEKLGQPAQPTVAHVQRLQAMKTGALLRFSCEAGAILARAGLAARRQLASYGASIGLAFQIADDLLDVAGDAVAMGKAVGKDGAKATLHSASDWAAARARLAALEAQAVAALACFGAEADILREAARFVVQRER